MISDTLQSFSVSVNPIVHNRMLSDRLILFYSANYRWFYRHKVSEILLILNHLFWLYSINIMGAYVPVLLFQRGNTVFCYICCDITWCMAWILNFNSSCKSKRPGKYVNYKRTVSSISKLTCNKRWILKMICS